MPNEKSTTQKKPTLLELARPVKRRPPSPSLSSGSDFDQPPISVTAQSRSCHDDRSLENVRNFLETYSDNSKLNPRSTRMQDTSDQKFFAKANSKSSNCLDPSQREAKTKSSNQSNSLSVQASDGDEIILPSGHCNYHIKAIRRGIPEIISTDTRGRTRRLMMTDIEISSYFLCQKKSKRNVGFRAWLFSIFVVFVCILCPLLSFAADIAFFVICTQHHNDTSELLFQVKSLYKAKSPPSTLVVKEKHRNEHHEIRSQRFHGPSLPLKIRRDAWLRGSPPHVIEKDEKLPLHSLKHVVRHTKRSLTPTSNITFTRIKDVTISMTSLPLPTDFEAKATTGITAKCYAKHQTAVCANQSELIKYLLTPDAQEQLDAHKHVTINVFEPVFILGSFPFLILCMLMRVVVMVTDHDHFLSAYFMNMITMPLQLTSGALSFQAASYHFGLYGIECWKCALTDSCSNSTFLWHQKSVSTSLIAAVTTKVMDGVAGGMVLVVVLLRIIWVKGGHASCWWHLMRCLLSLGAIGICLTVSTAMLLTPSLAVFLNEVIEKLSYFEAKTALCVSSLVGLSLGAIIWGASCLLLVIYWTYRTFVYCRINEHLTEDVLL